MADKMVTWTVLGLLCLGFCAALPQSKVKDPAPTCDQDACVLPACRCSTDAKGEVVIPGGLANNTIPQMVFLTFDDAVSKILYDNYYNSLVARTNPNGAPIGLTFFVTHEYTDYSVVNQLWAEGHEMASHSVTHKSDQSYWQNGNYQTWLDEMGGMREILANLANIPLEDVQGARAALLQLGGDNQYQAQVDAGLTWDCSWSTRKYRNPPLWPYTLDYLSNQDCLTPPCPTVSLPGYWVVPMVDLDYNNVPCAMMDTCVLGDNATADDFYNFFKTNFNRHYQSNRAPFGMYTHAAWFQYNGTWDGLNRFLDELAEMEDVYLVSIGDGLKWVQTPTTLDNIQTFEAWQPKNRQGTCDDPINCDYKTTPLGSERYMMSCVGCPPNYPWLGNPDGN